MVLLSLRPVRVARAGSRRVVACWPARHASSVPWPARSSGTTDRVAVDDWARLAGLPSA